MKLEQIQQEREGKIIERSAINSAVGMLLDPTYESQNDRLYFVDYEEYYLKTSVAIYKVKTGVLSKLWNLKLARESKDNKILPKIIPSTWATFQLLNRIAGLFLHYKEEEKRAKTVKPADKTNNKTKNTGNDVIETTANQTANEASEVINEAIGTAANKTTNETSGVIKEVIETAANQNINEASKEIREAIEAANQTTNEASEVIIETAGNQTPGDGSEVIKEGIEATANQTTNEAGEINEAIEIAANHTTNEANWEINAAV
ncbi:hypothetical protein BC938DRAFT_471663 [Jimgerdemannia flammicorona]|uniref:Uncharacterized protein n=1 Tax=Jimgerdemannia flammicorona TaxID=994334 RepID=A0A433Q7N7_9FUNG|nr:hypothetical protein BC938DRAFT_471663 [Jimgerdemannia flammicorona]